MNYYLGVDIGASSGRHMLGHMEDGKLILEEMYRFENRIKKIHGKDCWDIDGLLEEVLTGIKACVKAGKQPVSMAIDTWACDFVLLDEAGKRLCDCVSYRDDRVDGMMEEAVTIMDQQTLYERTGIQFQKFNTLYQLMALQKEDPGILEHAAHFLMVPDYLVYRLTGKITNEYTNASTTQLVNARTQQWDEAILDAFDLPKDIFHSFTKPGSEIGLFTKEIQQQTGCQIMVKECATHDTASAYASAKISDEIILSSGTWSLLGTIIAQSDTTIQARLANFTNEGAFDGRYRFLKNIMGLWIIQEVRHALQDSYSFAQLVEEARLTTTPPALIDVNEERFLHPKDMIKEIQAYCQEHDQPIPVTPGELANCVYHSLALSYGQAIKELERLTNKRYNAVNIVGGGCKNQLLNELVAQYTNKNVVAGPDEATVIGNIRMQIQEEKV